VFSNAGPVIGAVIVVDHLMQLTVWRGAASSFHR
jgi:hypothetical protein